MRVHAAPWGFSWCSVYSALLPNTRHVGLWRVVACNLIVLVGSLTCRWSRCSPLQLRTQRFGRGSASLMRLYRRGPLLRPPLLPRPLHSVSCDSGITPNGPSRSELGRRWRARSPLPCGCVVVPQPQLNFKTPPRHPETAARHLQDASRLPPDGFWLSTSSAGGMERSKILLGMRNALPTHLNTAAKRLQGVSRLPLDGRVFSTSSSGGKEGSKILFWEPQKYTKTLSRQPKTAARRVQNALKCLKAS